MKFHFSYKFFFTKYFWKYFKHYSQKDTFLKMHLTQNRCVCWHSEAAVKWVKVVVFENTSVQWLIEWVKINIPKKNLTLLQVIFFSHFKNRSEVQSNVTLWLWTIWRNRSTAKLGKWLRSAFRVSFSGGIETERYLASVWCSKGHSLWSSQECLLYHMHFTKCTILKKFRRSLNVTAGQLTALPQIMWVDNMHKATVICRKQFQCRTPLCWNMLTPLVYEFNLGSCFNSFHCLLYALFFRLFFFYLPVCLYVI